MPTFGWLGFNGVDKIKRDWGPHRYRKLLEVSSSSNRAHLERILEGTTPLLVACHHGQLDSVKHTTESWKVDVNNAATYFPDAVTKIDRATPLFVASTNGHLGIVRYLVGNGADILATTSTTNQRYDELTHLHGAVYDFNRQEEYKKLRYKKDKERAATVRYLLESGVDPSILPPDGSPI